MYLEYKDKVHLEYKTKVYLEYKDNVYLESKDKVYLEYKDRVYQEYKDNVYLEYNDEEKNPAGDINLVSGKNHRYSTQLTHQVDTHEQGCDKPKYLRNTG